MNAKRLTDKIQDILDEADTPEDAIFALASVQYTVLTATHCVTCKNFRGKT